jgi:hypothetical protein
MPHLTSNKNTRLDNVWRVFEADLKLDYLHSLSGGLYFMPEGLRT